MGHTTRAVVLDAAAAVAFIRDEPGADTVEALIRSAPSRMVTVNAAEAVDVIVRRHGGSPDETVSSIAALFDSVVEPVPASLELATTAGELRARLFDRRTRRLSLADCFCLAAAEPGDTILTGDRTLAAAARDEGIDVVLLET